MSDSVFRSEPDLAQGRCASIYATNFHRNEEVAPDDPALEQLYEFRLSLLSRGWEPIPVRGKNQLLACWTTGVITRQRIYDETFGGIRKLNTGFRTGQTVGVDNDLKDPEYAAAVDEIVEYFLGPTPLVRRGAKGAMLVYWNRNPIPKLTLSSRDGVRLFEILGQGQQFVGFGRHPDGIDYRWDGVDPSGINLSDVPEVSPNKLYRLNNTIRDLLIEMGFDMPDKPVEPKSIEKVAKKTKPIALQNALDWEDREALCRAALDALPNDVTREEWIAICFAIKDAGLGFDDWRDWCHRWTHGRNSERNISMAWNSCEPRQVTYKTLLKKADDANPSWRKEYRDELKRRRDLRFLESMKDWRD